jgi:LmbE family N-acetylglucosaminyl deacetylase
MVWIYLSPHLDDVALSCGGLLWELAQQGEPVSIWTVCAGDPPPGEVSPFARQLHTRWDAGQNAPAQRRIEDGRSCQLLGAAPRYFSIPDCIYRRHPQTHAFMYASEASLNGALDTGDAQVICILQEQIRQFLPAQAILVCPLALGNHVDHQLTRQAAEGLNCNLWYYADYPYVLRNEALVEQMEQCGWERHIFPISSAGLSAWMDSISAHTSQISTFWADDLAMRQAITEYWQSHAGICLWKQPVA